MSILGYEGILNSINRLKRKERNTFDLEGP